MILRNPLRRLAASAVAFALSTLASQAEPWPQRAVRLIVPFSAGTDLPARIFAEQLAQRWKQPVVIENRTGAEGLIGVSAFTGMHDDHTLLFHSAASITTFPVTHAHLPYDPARDIVPISSAVDVGIVMVAPESLKINSLAELVRLAQAQPGKLNYFPSNGGSFMILLPGFVGTAGLDMVQVSYRDAGLGLQDTAAGRVHLTMTALGTVLPLMGAGRVRLLAVTNKHRVPLAAEVQTVSEAGYPQLAFDGLQGFFGPRDMPAERRARIAADVAAVASDSGVIDRLAAVGEIARGSTPTEFAAEVEEQRADLATLAKQIGLEPTQ